MSFASLLTAFAAAVAASNGERLALLFTEDGIYKDGFLGAHTGRAPIAAMQRWRGRTCLFRFSYAPLLPEAAGRPVLF